MFFARQADKPVGQRSPSLQQKPEPTGCFHMNPAERNACQA
jgi:hypothetical protein